MVRAVGMSMKVAVQVGEIMKAWGREVGSVCRAPC